MKKEKQKRLSVKEQDNALDKLNNYFNKVVVGVRAPLVIAFLECKKLEVIGCAGQEAIKEEFDKMDEYTENNLKAIGNNFKDVRNEINKLKGGNK